MPNQNDPSQNQNNNQQFNSSPIQEPTVTPPVIFPQSDLPPLPPAFQDLAKNDAPNAPSANQPTDQSLNSNSGSDTPSDISSLIPKPKKKFGSGKIIATILGIVVLVGGVGAGVVVTQQQQILQPKACGESLSCTALTKDVANPVVNGTINLTCEADSSSKNLVAHFRSQAPGSSNFVEDPNSYPVDSSTHKANKSTQVNTAGAWVWQCRICTNSDKQTCTDWGQSN